MANPPSPLLLALREGTHASHKRLEQRLPFFSEHFDLNAYRQLLAAYLGFHAPLELALADHQPTQRHKAPALRHDLRALGLSDAELAALPLCGTLPAIDDEASALGVMYVLEGSTLGGQVLKRAMAERLGIDSDSGAAFLDVYGPLTGAHWRSFLDRLAQAALGTAAEARTVQAAISTFDCFEQWLAARRVLAH
ncbi:biliverdin-producing heme oxygenase [Pseudomonas sp. UFMG81]|uniref:biliverdin-producing heme oxygenase n=1 Tax=Pseudomonas sp. UFMG81 TaxID=2745936 RepID=UPI00188F6A3B|nr:biliverdin-producing heme oxygenase [Pseudomonas sp. UFMG81]